MVHKNRQEIMAMILSFIAASVLWLYVMVEKNPVKNIVINNVPVELINTDSLEQANLALLPDQNFSVDLSVSGKVSDIYDLTSSDFKLVADMSVSLRKGDNSIPVTVKSYPKGVAVNNGDFPYVIKVKLDSLTEKSVPVVVKVTGDAKQGYNYLEPVSRPTEVLVSGAATYVNSVSEVSGSIDISNSTANVTGSIPVKAIESDGSNVSYVTIEPKYIDITVPIKPSKEVPVVIRTTGRIPEGKAIKSTKPDIDSLIIIGDQKYLDKVKQIETTPFDISTLSTNSSRELELNIPTGISVFNGTKSINVDFYVENIIDKTIDVPISYLNENASYNYSFSNTNLSLTVTGAESNINSDSINDISASVNLSGYEEGTHNITVSINLPDGITLKGSPNDRIVVTITKK